jgi:hypothetical protein
MMTPVFEATPETTRDSSNPPSGRIDADVKNESADDRRRSSYSSSSNRPPGHVPERGYNDVHLD